jgi:hypothetical protein
MSYRHIEIVNELLNSLPQKMRDAVQLHFDMRAKNEPLGHDVCGWMVGYDEDNVDFN